MLNITKNEIDILKKSEVIKNNIKNEIKQDPEILNDYNLEDFMEIMSFLHPSTYGKYIQDRYIRDKGLNKVSSSNDRGDCKDQYNKHYELKTSFIDSVSNRINVVQIRPWQDVDFYDVIVIDKREEPFDISVYRLDRYAMAKECELLASPAHLTSEASKFNKNKELRFTIEADPFNYNYIRWERDYRLSYQEC